MSDPTRATLEKVQSRDEGRCASCGHHVHGERGRDWSLHHRRPRGAGGTSLAWVNLPANLILLCGSGTTACHGVIESNRATSYIEGFLVHRNGIRRADEVPIEHAVHGRVLLDDTGGVLGA
jgi:hypothetical protein